MDRVARLVPVAVGRAAKPEPTADGWRLQSESEYVVHGDSAALNTVLEALPRRVASRLGPLVRLTFGNSVGRVPAGAMGTLHLQSGKWNEGDYDEMLAGVAREALSLPFAANSVTGLPYIRDSEHHEEPAYHALVWLYHALIDTPLRPLLGALKGIVSDPHRRLVRSEREIPAELARSLEQRTIEDILSIRWPLQRVRNGLGVGGYMPLRIAETSVHQSIDTAENRFVRAFLDSCSSLLARVRGVSGRFTAERQRLVFRKVVELEMQLAPLLGAPMWHEVGRLTHLPTGSSVLQRDSRYREVLRASVLLRGATRALPLSEERAADLLEVKDVAVLYELWCGFVVLSLLRELLGPPVEVTAVTMVETGSTVPWGMRARWLGGPELAFNPTYTPLAGWHGRSMSVRLRPDLALYVGKGPQAGLHIFDAKFKHNDTADGTVVEADIQKMHTYRDAISGVRSAWVLFPGSRASGYPHGEIGAAVVGGVPLLPGRAHGELREHLGRIVAGH